jgi:hypothetical protein
MAGRPMMWLLPVVLLALTLLAIAVQRRATTLYGDVACMRGRHGHSLCPHPGGRWSHSSAHAAHPDEHGITPAGGMA